MNSNQSNIEQVENGLRLYSIHRAASLLHIGRDTLLTLIDRGEISTIDVLGRQKISLAELLKYENQKTRPIPLNSLPQSESTDKIVHRREIDQDTINKIFIESKKEVLSYEEKK